MSINTERKNLNEIQLARAMAIIAVLVVHSTSTGVTSISSDSFLFPFYNFLNIAGKLGTPTFILLSSFVLFYNYYPRKTTSELLKRFYVKRFKYILIPYIMFSGIYFILKWIIYYDYPNFGAAIDRFLELLAVGKAHPHLYFVFISIQLYILFPLFLMVFKKYSFVRKNAIWIGILLQWLWVILNHHYFNITMKGSISLSYLSFYFIGAYLGIYYNDIKAKMKHDSFKEKVMTPIFIGYGVMIVTYTGYMYLARIGVWYSIKQHLPDLVVRHFAEFAWAMHALMASLVVFYLAHVVEKRFTPWMKSTFMEIGATSFGIYLIHPLLLMFFREVYSSGPPILYHGWQVFTFLAVGILSWMAVRFTYRFFPSYWVIFGKMSPIVAYEKKEKLRGKLLKNA